MEPDKLKLKYRNAWNLYHIAQPYQWMNVEWKQQDLMMIIKSSVRGEIEEEWKDENSFAHSHSHLQSFIIQSKWVLLHLSNDILRSLFFTSCLFILICTYEFFTFGNAVKSSNEQTKELKWSTQMECRDMYGNGVLIPMKTLEWDRLYILDECQAFRLFFIAKILLAYFIDQIACNLLTATQQ